jgi:hypothetical protein
MSSPKVHAFSSGTQRRYRAFCAQELKERGMYVYRASVAAVITTAVWAESDVNYY